MLRIGDEAVVDAQDVQSRRPADPQGAPVDRRVKRHGWRVEVVDDREVSAALERELAEAEADWRSRQRRLIGFAMTLGRLAGADERDGGVYVLAGTPGPSALVPALRLLSRRGSRST